MKIIKTISIILAIFTIAGCSAGQESTSNNIPTVPSLTVIEATPIQQLEPTYTPPTIKPAPELVSECTVVSSLPGHDDEIPDVFVVKEDDWVIGPEDAAITIIEYGDFQ